MLSRKWFWLILFLLVASGFILGALARSNIYLSDRTKGIQDMLASVFFAQSVTVPGLEAKFHNQKNIKILVVPGHEPNFGGAEYRNLKERDMNVDLANDLANYLGNDPRFQIMIARDKNNWNPILADYFTKHWNDIKSFTQTKKATMNQLISAGEIIKVTDGVPHAAAPANVATRLFGINKWADENGVDIMIHIHFNDYPRAKPSQPGAYTGFTIYVPDSQYSNAAATRAMAGNIFTRLAQSFHPSTLPKESVGVVDDQDLIAIGEGNTVDGVSMLIEYGYIYEPQFADPTTRKSTLDAMAQKTYLGLEDFFANPTRAY